METTERLLGYALEFHDSERADWCATHEALERIERSSGNGHDILVLVGTVPQGEQGTRASELRAQAVELARQYGGQVVTVGL